MLPKFNANVARWIEPHDTPANTERDYYDWYGTRSKQWGSDASDRRLYDWAPTLGSSCSDIPQLSATVRYAVTQTTMKTTRVRKKMTGSY